MASTEIQPAPDPKSQATYARVGEKLPIGIKLAYGMPNFAGAAMVIPIAIHMNLFYSDTVLVPMGFIALAIAAARALDAITDPLMGWISDHTNTRWGRRIPWMFIGAPLCAVSFVLLFSPPEDLMGTPAAGWFAITFMLYFLFHTVYVIPHYGLGPELTPDYKERSSLFAWMEGFTLLGTMCAAALPGLVLIPMLGARRGYIAFAVIFGSLLTLLYFWQCYRIKERPEYYQQAKNPLVPGVRRVMRNRPFRILLASYVVGSISGAIPGLMTPYFVKYVLKPENPDQLIGLYLLTYFATGFLTLPFWLRLVRRFGKKPISIVSRVMGVCGSLMLFTMGEGDVVPSLLVLVWSGTAFGPAIFLGPSIQADVIDYDELYTGRRREAQYGAMWAIMTKFTVIPSAAVPLALLASLGYVPNVDQSETVRFAISAIYGLVPAGCGILSVLVFVLFPIKEKEHRAILEGIDAHKRGESAEDPLTGRVLPPPSDRGIDEQTGWFLDHFSERELARFATGGPGTLVRSATVAGLISYAISAAAIGAVVISLGDLSQKPGATMVFLVVIGGFALTAGIYHSIRLRAAFKMRSRPVESGTVGSHLELTDNLRQVQRAA
jgi:GPH family glycoside/pentoside/hexuronide:cation symporter